MNEILLYILAIALGDVVFNWLCFALMFGIWQRWFVAGLIGLGLVVFRHIIPMVGIWYLTCVLLAISHAILTSFFPSDGDDEDNSNHNEVY